MKVPSCLLLLLAAVSAHAAAPPALKLWRLDCGTIRVDDLNEYSDTFAYPGKSRRFSVGCYLIQHGEDYLLWDTGLSEEVLGKPLGNPGTPDDESLSVTVRQQLAQIGVKPEQISLIGISHYHFDHTGQAQHFPKAKLLLGKGDVTVLRTPGSKRAKPLAPWFEGGSPIEEIDRDQDIFGDGSVEMIHLPGHTPGHHGLLVRLPKKGAVLLSGDVAHFKENYENDGVPTFNVDRADSLASLSRFKEIAKHLNATVIIQHESGDVGKLPKFPAFAE